MRLYLRERVTDQSTWKREVVVGAGWGTGGREGGGGGAAGTKNTSMSENRCN